MARTFAVMGMSGGVGRTTTAVQLSAALGEVGKRVLLIDMHGQRNASLCCGWQQAQSPDLADAVLGRVRLEELVVSTTFPGVDLIPGAQGLYRIDNSMPFHIGIRYFLKDQMDSLADDWDYIIYDCPRDIDTLGTAVLLAVDYVLVLSTPRIDTIERVRILQERIEWAKRTANPSLQMFGIVCRQMQQHSQVLENEFRAVQSGFPDKVFKRSIRHCNDIMYCRPGLSIFQHAPMSKGAIDYWALAAEFLARQQDDLLKLTPITNKPL